MKTRHSILTLALGSTLLLASAAQARTVLTERSLPTRTAATSHISAVALKEMGIRYQAARNVREEHWLGSGSTTQSTFPRPDDRSGIHGAGLSFATSA